MDYKRVIPTVLLSDITDEVRIMYSSYFESNLSLDDTIFLPRVRYILKKLSLPIHSIQHKVLEVENYKAHLPENYYKLIVALGSFEQCEYIPANELDPVEITEFRTDYKINECILNECTNECNQYLNVIQRVNEGSIVKYNNVTPLSISKRTWGSTDSNCFNRYTNSDNQIDIIDNVINTNFESGYIYIEYYTTQQNEDGEFLVPEDEVIRNAFYENIKEVALEYILLNTTQPIQQIFGMQSNKAREALKEALIRTRTPTYQQSLDIGNYMKRRFNKYSNSITTPTQLKYKY